MPGNKSKRSHGARAEDFIKRSGLAVDGDGTLRKKKPGAYNPAAVGMAIVQERHMAGARAGHFRRTATAKRAVARGGAAAAASPPGGGAAAAASTPKSRAAVVVYDESPEYVEAMRAFQAKLEAGKAAEAAKKGAAAAALVALRERRQAFIAKWAPKAGPLLPRIPVGLREMAALKAAEAKEKLAKLRVEIAEEQCDAFVKGWERPDPCANHSGWRWGDLATNRDAEVARLVESIRRWSERARRFSLHPLIKFTPPAVALPAKLSRHDAEVAATAAAVEEIKRVALPDYLVAAEEGDTTGSTAIIFKNLRECRGKEQLIRAHKDLTTLIEGMRCRLAAKQGVYIKTDYRDKTHSTGVAFVNFATTEDCHKCMTAMRAKEDGVWLFDAATNTERQLMPEFSISKRKSSAEMAAEEKTKAAAKVKAAEEAEARKAAVRAAMAGSMGDGTSRTPVALVTGRAGKTAFTVVEAATAASGAAPTLAKVNLGATAKARKAEAEAARMAQVKAEFAAMFATPLAVAVAPSKPNRTQLVVSFKQVVAMPALAPAVIVIPRTFEEDMAEGIMCGAAHPDFRKQQNLLRRSAIEHKARLIVTDAAPFEGYAPGEAEAAIKKIIKAHAGSKVFTPYRG